jgi:hypothetical protein
MNPAIDCILAALSAQLEDAGYKLGHMRLDLGDAVLDVACTMGGGYRKGLAQAIAEDNPASCEGEGMMPGEGEKADTLEDIWNKR